MPNFSMPKETKEVEHKSGFKAKLRYLTYGDQVDISDEATKYVPRGNMLVPKVNIPLVGLMKIVHSVTWWNNEDEKGKVKPIDRQTVKDLNPDIGNWLLVQINLLNQVSEEELGESEGPSKGKGK